MLPLEKHILLRAPKVILERQTPASTIRFDLASKITLNGVQKQIHDGKSASLAEKPARKSNPKWENFENP